MLGQASAIKARNQVSEYPPLSKLAGCFFVPRYWLQRYDKNHISGTFLPSFFIFSVFSLFTYLSHPLILDLMLLTDALRLKGQLLRQDFDIPLPLGERKIAIPMDAIASFLRPVGSGKAERLCVTPQQLSRIRKAVTFSEK